MPAQVRSKSLDSPCTCGADRQHIDALTSETPTFPYLPEECEKFIDLLQRGKGVFRLHNDMLSSSRLVLGRSSF
jgi:hypothetical protein